MKKRELKKIFAGFLLASSVLTACSSTTSSDKTEEKKQEEVKEEDVQTKEVSFGQAFQEAVAELEKAKEGKDVDFDKVNELYTTHLQGLVKERDTEFEDTIDQHITTALAAGKDGSMDKVVVKQLFDKLMQKVFYTTIKHEFTEVTENWTNKDVVKEEVEEAKEYYAIIQTTVEKRDAAYGTNMVDAIAGGFDEIEKAVEADDQLGFNLGKQVVDKTLMKTFYFATGAIPNGYATKAAAAAKENAEEAKIGQAEGWAFYQSIFAYLNKHAEEDATYILGQFDLQTDVTTLDPAAVNKAFVRGFSKIALHEYEESVEAWGEDKSVITALEGALFIDVIGEDIKAIIGEAEYTALTEKAQKYLEAAKAKDKATADSTLVEIQETLNTVISSAK
ncbi:hypothetical protein [Robertmurraya korlensis]|uniref:hypothetical protein n=1 Tax=Robertmurraya korlensis TaxID=519977 RepID=UPI000824DF84|nr:hypothetical protein [Robertmurraya korlensis]